MSFFVTTFFLECAKIYTQAKKETSDFHGTVSFDPVKML